MSEKKRIRSNLIWGILALSMMNGVLQIIVYPLLSVKLGTEQFGNVLFVLGIAAIITPAVGLSVNNTRLLERRSCNPENGDFFLTLLTQLLPLSVVFFVATRAQLQDGVDYVLGIVLLLMMTLRYYADVEYRLSLKYRGYFVYYLVLSVGYCIGFLLFYVTGRWIICFLTGEVLVFLYILKTGHIILPMVCTKYHKQIQKSAAILTVSYLLYNGVLNLDRILLQMFVNSEAVSVFYVASLLGKTIALFVGPLNSILLAYLTKDQKTMTRKQFAKAVGLCGLCGGLLYLCTVIAAPIFINLFYPSIAEDVLQIVHLANLSQIMCFSSSLLLTIMLSFCAQKWQVLIQVLYAGAFILLAGFAAMHYGVEGFAVACVAVNIFRLVLTVSLGFYLV